MKRQSPPRLSARLRALMDMMMASGSHYESAADIGCDHGWIAISLILDQVADRVIASDVREGPLERAVEHVKEYGLSDRIDTVLAGGMEHLQKGKVDAALIAGMGGFLIRDILKEAAGRDALCNTLVLQPQNGWEEVRRCVWSLGYAIIREDMVLEDGKYYVILRAEKEQQETRREQAQKTDLEEKFGPLLLESRHAVLKQYLLTEKEKFEEILKRLEKAGNQGTEQKERLESIDRALAYWKEPME